MKRCLSCGAEIGDSSKFCPQCGEKVEEVQEVSMETEVVMCLQCGGKFKLRDDLYFCPCCGEASYKAGSAARISEKEMKMMKWQSSMTDEELQSKRAELAAKGKELCHECGTVLDKETKFCTYCGEDIKATWGNKNKQPFWK